MNGAPPLFTASQIARAIGKSPSSVRRALAHVSCSTVVQTDYGEANAWELTALPTALLQALDANVRVGHFRDRAALLEHHRQPDSAKSHKIESLRELWTSASNEPREKAVKLQRALLPALLRYDSGELAGAELEAIGLEHYAREFGHQELSPRTWRNLVQRSRERARSAQDYQLVHLFLDENCSRKRAAAPALNFDECFGPLHSLITAFHDPEKPTWKEQEALWDAACELCRSRLADKRFKRTLVNFLWNFAPTLSPTTKAALRVNLWRKLKFGVADLRRAEFITPVPLSAEKMAQIDLAAAHAGVNHGKRGVSASVNELQAMGLYEQDGGKSKSYVKASDRRLIRRKARIVAMAERGSRGLRELTPTLTRDPLTCFANDIYTGDDFTMPVLCWWEAPNEKGFGWGNGQTLIMSDFATWFVTAFSHQPDAQYNSHVVKTLLTRAGMEHGLPKLLYFERGQIWQHSKILKGDDERGDNWRDASSDAEFVYGLKTQLGIRFMHARTPAAKSQIERLGGVLQDLMFGEPGYTGRDQRVDLPERTRREIAQVKAGVHPSKFWYHIDAWRKRLGELIHKYNNTQQEGRWVNWTTPNDAFVNRQRPDDPPIKLDAHSWPILACQKRRCHVREDGKISFRITGLTYEYFNEESVVRLGGETVLLHWNPETPEFVGVTDLKGRNPILVPRVMQTHTFDVADPRTQVGLTAKSRCAAALKAQYETLPVKGVRKFRPTIVSRDTAELAHKMTERRAEMATEKRTNQTLHRRALRALERSGMSLKLADVPLNEEIVRGFEDMAETFDSERTEEQT